MRSDSLVGTTGTDSALQTAADRTRRGARSARDFKANLESAGAAATDHRARVRGGLSALFASRGTALTQTPALERSGLAALCSPQPASAAPRADAVIALVEAEGRHVPTVEEVFGGSPFLEDPQGQFVDASTGQLRTYGFNPMYFATESAAQKLATQLGGTVVERHAIVTSYFTQVQPNRMILLPNGRELNAGLVAHFYTHGYPQSYIDRLIAHEINPEGQYGNVATPVTTVRNGALTPAGLASVRSA